MLQSDSAMSSPPQLSLPFHQHNPKIVSVSLYWATGSWRISRTKSAQTSSQALHKNKEKIRLRHIDPTLSPSFCCKSMICCFTSAPFPVQTVGFSMKWTLTLLVQVCQSPEDEKRDGLHRMSLKAMLPMLGASYKGMCNNSSQVLELSASVLDIKSWSFVQ
jgi:hypothetical protein